MLPPSSFPETASPRKKRGSIWQFVGIVATALLVAAFIGVLVARGAGGRPEPTAGSVATATTATSTISTATVTEATAATGSSTTSTPAQGATPPPASGGTSGQQTGKVRVTQNQDMRPACLDDTAPYTVVLYNAGNVPAKWHVYIPAVVGLAARGPTDGPHRLASPFSSYPYWANAKPQDGSIAPGQTASFVMSPVWEMPCGGKSYHASVQLSFPPGTSQADIPLSYAGTGPSRYSNVVLVSGTLNMTQACPASGSAPAPFTFAIKNTGNYQAYPYIDTTKETVGATPWADVSSTTSDSPKADMHWLYPGETWTITVAPIAGVLCGGTTYHASLYADTAQGTTQSWTFTITFN